jgi:two-component system, NarL family, response regulator DesR
VIRLLLADDQALVRGALAALLNLEPDLEVVAEVDRGDRVVDAARDARPDVAVLDIEMPGLDGIAATAALRESMPGCRVLVVTTFGRPGYLRRAMEAGPPGSSSRTPPRASSPTRSAGWPRGCGWSTPRWPPRRSRAGSHP